MSDDLKKFVRGDSKRTSADSRFAQGKKLFIDTASVATPSAQRKSSFIFSSKNHSVHQLVQSKTVRASPHQVIREKLRFFEKVGSPLKKTSPRDAVQEFFDVSGERIHDLICFSNLNKATKIVQNHGLQRVSLSYVRQLKQFCNQVLKSFEEIKE
jgi:hypothetical protein